ncbi:AMP-binding protein [Metabacillus sp. FJAT-53654]|uniref:AMP-binding protein n=1 Tax=Metabacillus rhizosphaerae TaxID=3117747 RepID=A0ABZ2MRQ2_9BACI
MATITKTYSQHVRDFPEKIAIYTKKENITYRNWYERVTKTANWLDSFDCSTNTLGILLPNGIHFLQLFTGASTAGWICVPLDLRWKESELQKRLALSKPSILITTKDKYPMIKELYQNVLIWEDCLEGISNQPVEQGRIIDTDLPFYMGFTSGSTGEPKAFIRGQHSWINSFDCNRFDFLMNDKDHVLIPGSLIHSHFLYGAISTLFLGGTLYLLEKFSSLQALTSIQTQPISVVYVVPTMIEAVLKEKCKIGKKLKLISSGAKWEAHSKTKIRDMFYHSTMYEYYGASELSFVTVLSDRENKQRPGSVGKPCYSVEIQIRNSNHELAKVNEVGKIFVRSKMIFMGYVCNDTQVIRSNRDKEGWITVDDMGFVDNEGFLYIVGREKNMILYGGINIYAEEVEAVLTSHPDVHAAAVIGTYDKYWGQIVTAVIEGNASKMELRKLCKMILASYKIPRKWHFMKEIPLTTSGKIARPKIQEMVESKVNGH